MKVKTKGKIVKIVTVCYVIIFKRTYIKEKNFAEFAACTYATNRKLSMACMIDTVTPNMNLLIVSRLENGQQFVFSFLDDRGSDNHN